MLVLCGMLADFFLAIHLGGDKLQEKSRQRQISSNDQTYVQFPLAWESK